MPPPNIPGPCLPCPDPCLLGLEENRRSGMLRTLRTLLTLKLGLEENRRSGILRTLRTLLTLKLGLEENRRSGILRHADARSALFHSDADRVSVVYAPEQEPHAFESGATEAVRSMEGLALTLRK